MLLTSVLLRPILIFSSQKDKQLKIMRQQFAELCQGPSPNLDHYLNRGMKYVQWEEKALFACLTYIYKPMFEILTLSEYLKELVTKAENWLHRLQVYQQ